MVARVLDRGVAVAGDRLAVDLQQHVAGAQAGLLRRAVGRHRGDAHAAARRGWAPARCPGRGRRGTLMHVAVAQRPPARRRGPRRSITHLALAVADLRATRSRIACAVAGPRALSLRTITRTSSPSPSCFDSSSMRLTRRSISARAACCCGVAGGRRLSAACAAPAASAAATNRESRRVFIGRSSVDGMGAASGCAISRRRPGRHRSCALGSEVAARGFHRGDAAQQLHALLPQRQRRARDRGLAASSASSECKLVFVGQAERGGAGAAGAAVGGERPGAPAAPTPTSARPAARRAARRRRRRRGGAEPGRRRRQRGSSSRPSSRLAASASGQRGRRAARAQARGDSSGQASRSGASSGSCASARPSGTRQIARPSAVLLSAMGGDLRVPGPAAGAGGGCRARAAIWRSCGRCIARRSPRGCSPRRGTATARCGWRPAAAPARAAVCAASAAARRQRRSWSSQRVVVVDRDLDAHARAALRRRISASLTAICRSQAQNGRRAAAAELADPVEHLEHRVLQHVGGFLAVARSDAQRQREHRPLEPAVELLERRRLAGARAGEQGVGHVDGEGRSGARHRCMGCAGRTKRRSAAWTGGSVAALVVPPSYTPGDLYSGIRGGVQ